jgi:hypothetical protein
MPAIGRTLVVLGGVLVVIGLITIAAPKIPFFGKLPGDICIKREDFEFYFPLTTSLLVSLMLSGILWLFRYLTKK